MGRAGGGAMTPSGFSPRPRSHIVEPVTTGSVAALVSRYGLLAVFGGTLLEGEGILIVAATLSAQGVLDPVRVWLVAAAGAWLGHLFWFTTGRAIRGRRLALGSAATRARVAKVKRLIEARPVTAILLLQYLYGLRLVGAVALGLTECPSCDSRCTKSSTASFGPASSVASPICLAGL